MQLQETFEIIEVYGPQHANHAIQNGWKLLAVTGVSDPHGGTQIVSCYVFGKPKPSQESSKGPGGFQLKKTGGAF